LLDRYKRRGQARLWLLPPLTVLWVNCHGGFITAFILMGGYLVGEGLNWLIGWRAQDEGVLSARQLRTLLLVMLVCLAAVALNPQTVRMYTYPFETVGIGVLRDFIQEWRSPDFHQLHLHPFIWMLFLTLAAMAFSGQRADFTDVGLVTGLAYMSLLAGRNMALFALLDGPILARYAAPALARLFRAVQVRWGHRFTGLGRAWVEVSVSIRWALLNWALLGLVVAAALVKVALPIWPTERDKALVDALPVEAVQFIRQEEPAGPMFNSYNWGGYLIWTLYPDYLVFVDGRTDLYADPFLRDYVDVLLVRDNWRQVLARYGVRLILIEQDSVLARFLAADDGWQSLYHDELAAVFGRR